nr:putative plastid-lipid-associated protein 4, chloroplastic [Quercus suber]
MVTMSSLPSPLTPKLFTKSPNPPILTVRNCGSITAKPSSDIRRKNRAGSEPDEKLRRLRELFVKPGIDIDAYIVPSQDAHQVTANLVPLNSRRVAVKFDFFSIAGLIPIKSPGSGRGQLEITYLDEELRV